MKLYAQIKREIAVVYEAIAAHTTTKYVKEVIIGLSVITILVVGYVLNRWYVNYREEKAVDALSEILISYNHAQQLVLRMQANKDKQQIEQAWQDVITLLDALYQDHSHSKLAPYFLTIKSDAVLEKTGNLQEALDVLDQAIARISLKSYFVDFFKLKRIKMALDLGDQDKAKEALQQLINLSNNTTSLAQYQALYTLGVYYLAQGSVDLAQKTLKNLIDIAPANDVFNSVWAKQAQEKLGIAS